jgi:uncharacterized protein (TIGR02145 family)
MKNKFLFIQLLMIGLLLTLTNSCKKDDTTSSKKDPIITWANPADITVGTLLSATQLNATADVPGNFVYTPAVGASLVVGANQDLKVDFTPTDAATYNVASKTVKINVIQPTGDGGVTSAVFNTTKTYGTMTDQNGNTYKTITIGTQTWMAENLRVTKYRNGDPIPNVTDNAAWVALTTGAYCSYGNTANKDDIASYGRLYNWYAASDSRNIAPTGWHLPSDAEWTTLTTYLGGETVAGGKMKEAGTTHWTSPNTSATNESGFTALPSGNRDSDGPFGILGDSGDWWSSTANGATDAWNRVMGYNYANCDRYGGYVRLNGFAVRLIKD